MYKSKQKRFLIFLIRITIISIRTTLHFTSYLLFYQSDKAPLPLSTQLSPRMTHVEIHRRVSFITLSKQLVRLCYLMHHVSHIC